MPEDEALARLRLEADPGNTAQVMSAFTESFNKASQSSRGLVQSLGDASKGIMDFIGPAAVGAFIASSIKMAANVEESGIRMRQSLKLTTEQVKEIKHVLDQVAR